MTNSEHEPHKNIRAATGSKKPNERERREAGRRIGWTCTSDLEFLKEQSVIPLLERTEQRGVRTRRQYRSHLSLFYMYASSLLLTMLNINIFYSKYPDILRVHKHIIRLHFMLLYIRSINRHHRLCSLFSDRAIFELKAFGNSTPTTLTISHTAKHWKFSE